MERTFFFLGFCLPSIQAGGGTMRMSQMEKEGEKRMLGASQGRSATARGGVAEFSSMKISVTWGGIFHLLLFLFGGIGELST